MKADSWLRAVVVTALLGSLLLLGGCVGNMPPVVNPVVVFAEKKPVVIFVSGLTGSVLYDKLEQQVTWGDFRSGFLPRDFGYAAVRPIGPAEDRIEARGPIMAIRFGPLYRREVYRPLKTTLEANGYVTGVDFRAFGYDWRQSNVAAARRLVRFIDELNDEHRVVLVCQSSGGYLCRWAVRFGDVSLDEAEAGVVRPPRRLVDAVIFVGTTHSGSIRILREIDRGRTYVRFGRFLSPEAFFTFESLVQDLPPWRTDLFVGEDGHPLDVDVFDAREWVRYGWAIFGNEAEARADERPDLFGTRDDRVAYLQRALDDARRFHTLLRDGPAPSPGIRYYSIQNRTRATIHRAMLVKHNSGWQTLFTGDELVGSRPELASIMSTLGDGHASAAGQEELSAGEMALLAEPIIEVDGDHLGVVQSAGTRRAILRIISKSLE
jgi:hypothetical protein